MASPNQSAPSLVTLARGLVPAIRSRDAECEALGKLPDATVADLDKADLFRILVPTVYGGHQASLRDFMGVCTELGRGDGAVAWTFSLISTHMWILAALFPDAVAEAVFNSAGCRASGVIAPRAIKLSNRPDGLLIESGVWSFNSGVYHADWDLLGIPMLDDSGRVVGAGYALVPVSELSLLNDWNTIGLNGTGSTSVSAENVFVPHDRIVSVGPVLGGEFPPNRLRDIPLYRTPLIPFLATKDVFPLLGMAKAALDLVLETIGEKPITYTLYERQDEAPAVQMQVADAAAKIDAAEAVLQRTLNEIDASVTAGDVMARPERTRAWRDAAYATSLLWEATDHLAGMSGSAFFKRDGRMNRIWRNARVASMHAGLRQSTAFEIFGAVALGREPKSVLA